MVNKNILIKEKEVTNLIGDIKKSRTLMIVSVKGLPSKQFQEIKKSLRDIARVKIARKNIILRTVKKFGKESISPLESYVTSDCAFVISDTEGYDLAAELFKRKTPVFAKTGQIAPMDIEVKAGPTDLTPGPAISELGTLGIQISVEGGKISIRVPKVIIKEGAVITENVASILQKLKVQPFSVGLIPIAIYDVKEEKVYANIKIDSDYYAKELSNAAGKSLGFAQRIFYYCKETIGYFLAKGRLEAETLNKLNKENN